MLPGIRKHIQGNISEQGYHHRKAINKCIYLINKYTSLELNDNKTEHDQVRLHALVILLIFGWFQDSTHSSVVEETNLSQNIEKWHICNITLLLQTMQRESSSLFDSFPDCVGLVSAHALLDMPPNSIILVDFNTDMHHLSRLYNLIINALLKCPNLYSSIIKYLQSFCKLLIYHRLPV